MGIVECSDGESSYFRHFWTYGSHLGEAVDKIVRLAKDSGARDPYLSEINEYEEYIPENAYLLDDGESYVSEERWMFPPEPGFRLPYGVSLTEGEHDHDDAEIVPAFEVFIYDDGLMEVSAVVEENSLVSLYERLLSITDELDVFWIKLPYDWECEEDEDIRYVAEGLNTPKRIVDYIKANRNNTLLNGYITMTAYADTGETNFNISDHKELMVLTYDQRIRKDATDVFRSAGLKQKKSLITIGRGFHHWHYRPTESLDRETFIKKLVGDGFELIEE